MSNTAGGNTTTTGAAAAPHFGSYKPPKFDEEGGFDLYKAMLQSYLMQRVAWGILDGTDMLDANATAAETQRFEEKNALARDALLRGVLVKDATKICMLASARDMWVTFEQEKTRRAFSNALYLRKKLYAHTYKSGMDMDKYLDDMEAMRRQLRNMNDEISDTDMVKLILQGVAFEYRGVVRMFDKDVRDGNMPLLSEVLNTLRSEAEIDKQRNSIGKKANKSEEAKILQVKQQQQFSGAKGKRRWKQNKNANMKKKFKGKDGQAEEETRTCFFCHRPGHLKRDCDEYLDKQRQKKAQKNGAPDEKTAAKKRMSLVRWSGAGGGKPSSIGMVRVNDADDHDGQGTLAAAVHSCDANFDEWMVDTGAGVHVCTDWSAFSSLREDSVSFIGWQGDTSKSEACGQVNIGTIDVVSGTEVTLELEDARYTSGGLTNLLSLERLEQCGWVPSYSDTEDPAQRVMYLDRGGVWLEMPKRDGHYWLQTKRAAAGDVNMCMVTTTQKQSQLMRWHMRFAHLNAQAMKQMVLKDMVDGMKSLKLKDFDEPLDCIACTTAKQKRRSYKRHNKRSKVCYERIMSGVCPIGVETIGGNIYFQLIQDEASRYKWCYLLRHKDESTPNVKNLILELEKEHNIKWFSSDRGGEFINNKMKRFLADHGIKLWKTNAYTPEENCLVEKLNGTLMNKVRAICETTGLPDSLWGEVLMYVVEVDNMSPIKALSGMTPYERLTGTKPDVGNLHVCGCVAFAHVPKKKRASKLSPKAVPTLFLGYAQTSLGFRLLDLRSGDLIERRDVSFREDITVDSAYMELLLARRYDGSQEELPLRVPYVRLPVNAVLETVHIPDRRANKDSDDEMLSVDGDTTMGTKKRRRADSSGDSDDSSDDVDFSGSFTGGNSADSPGDSESSTASSPGSIAGHSEYASVDSSGRNSPATRSTPSSSPVTTRSSENSTSATTSSVATSRSPSPPATGGTRDGAVSPPQPIRRSTRIRRPILGMIRRRG